MLSRIGARLALSVFVTTLATAAQAQFVYSTGFEFPEFDVTKTATIPIPGALGGGSFTSVPGSTYTVPSWGFAVASTGASAASFKRAADATFVQNTVARAGSQALLVDGAIANQDVFGGFYAHTSPRGGVIDVSFDMLVTNASAQAGQWGFVLYDSNNRSFGGVGFFSGLLVSGSGTNLGLPPGPITPVGYNNWATYGVRYDLNVNTMSVTLNGVAVPSMQSIPIRTDIAYSSVSSYGFGGNVPFGVPYSTTPERAYFDNFRLSVAAAPEPGSMAFVLLGGTLVVLRARRKK